MKKDSLVPYFILLFISTVVAIILRYWGGPMLIHLYFTDYQLCDSDKCVGYGAVYRISWALFLFFFGHALLLLAKSCYRIDEATWWLKMPLFLALLVIAYFFPDDFYSGYLYVARVIAGIFLVLQIVLLIHCAYSLNEDWTSEEKDWKCAVLSLASLLYALSLAACILCFIYFAGSGCPTERFFVSFTLVLTFISTGLSISNYVEKGGILPASFITAYAWWLCYSALSSDPSSCNTANDNSTAQLIVGLALGALSITYSAYSVAMQEVKDEDHHVAASSGGSVPQAEEGDKAKEKDVEAQIPEPPSAGSAGRNRDDSNEAELDDEQKVIYAKSRQRFHLCVAAASMYMAMLLTNWGSNQEAAATSNNASQSNVSDAYDLSNQSMWIKIVSQWITILLFVWSLIAPKILTNRDFS